MKTSQRTLRGKKPTGTFDYAARIKMLKQTQAKIRALHRHRGNPNVSNMSAGTFNEEVGLFDILRGTVFITADLQKRADAIFRENSSRFARAMSSQF